jgi:hypothetical protein
MWQRNMKRWNVHGGTRMHSETLEKIPFPTHFEFRMTAANFANIAEIVENHIAESPLETDICNVCFK